MSFHRQIYVKKRKHQIKDRIKDFSILKSNKKVAKYNILSFVSLINRNLVRMRDILTLHLPSLTKFDEIMNKKQLKQISLFLLSLAASSVSSVNAKDAPTPFPLEIVQQKETLTGVILDSSGPVIGATVSVKGTSIGAITDMEGQFSLQIPAGSVLSISFIGYVTQEIKYTGQKNIRVVLKEDALNLDEVVVTAMGIKKEKRALSYAMSELKANELTTVPTPNLANSLYGKAAGVQIMQTAAGAMGGTKIQIRGINSVEGSSRPLIVVDGIPVNDNDSDWGGRERSQTQQGSALNDINPDDIESMSILKGANAAALYGSRATNGVIVITTKRGSTQKGLGISVNTSYTYDQLADMPEYQNVFGGGSSSQFVTNAEGQKVYKGDTYRSFGPRMDGTPVLWWDGQIRPYSPQPDNYKSFFKNGFSNNNSISISNRSENASFRVSYTNVNFGGNMNNMKQTKHNFSLSGNFKLSNRITFDASINYNITDKQNTPTRIDRVSNYPMPRNEISQLWKDQYKNSEGYFLTDELSSISSGNRDNIINYLLWQQNENRYTNNRERLIASLSANIRIIESLNLKVRGGTDRYSDKSETKEMFKKYADPADMNNLQGNYEKTDNHYTKNYADAMLMYNQKFVDDFDLSMTLGASVEDISETGTSCRSQGLKYNGMFSTANNKKNPKDANKDSGYSRGEFMGAVFASGQIAYKRFLYLDLTARNDWSSRLSRDNRSFFYPSAGLGFIFSDAFDMPRWMNYGKLRASYAIVGNTAPSLFFTNAAYQYDSFGGTAITNSFNDVVPPLNIEPEKTYSWEFGFETHLLNNRLSIDVAYYTNRTKNQILEVPVAPSTGASKMKYNAGEIGNHGVEIQLGATPVETKKFNWRTVVNFAYTRNKMISLIKGMDDRMISNPWNACLFKAVPGYATPSIFIQKWERDDNGNLLVDDNGKYIKESEFTYAGNAAPKFTGGFSNTFTYGPLSLFIHIDGQFGGKIMSISNNFMKASGVAKESLFGRDEEYGGLPYYIEEGTNKKILLNSHTATAPISALDGKVYHDGMISEGVKKSNGSTNDIVMSAADYYNGRYNDYGTEDNLYDNTYIKLREVKLSYSIPSQVCRKIGFQNLNVSLLGSNLFFIYKSLPNLNPESTLGTGGTNSYVEYTAYPSSRSFGFSLNASF